MKMSSSLASKTLKKINMFGTISPRKIRYQKSYLNFGHLRYICFTYSYSDTISTFLPKQPMLAISKYHLHMKRSEHYKSKIQKYVIKPISSSKHKGLSHTDAVNTLLKCASVSEQIECFDSSIKLPMEELSERSSICQKLEKILEPYYSPCTVHLVGSSINGLGIRGCDMDLSLQYPHANDKKDLIHGNAAFHDEICEGKLPDKKLYNFTPRVQLLTIRKILQEEKFEEPITVIPGRCPILNFCFKNLSCDLAINNSSALHGTQLMLLCGKLDERVPKLMRIIIYWAKHSKLVGGLGKFKSYAIFLLVVYFLQTRSPPVLPPVNIMFAKTEFMDNLHNWSYSIEKYLSAFKQSENTQSIEELLKEFFFFYGNFDFNYIICPINSNAIDSKTFASEVDCENNFKLNTICIQDPISPCWNVSTEVAWKNCKNFLKSIISVCERYQEPRCWIPGSSSWGLASLINGRFSYSNIQEIREFTLNIALSPDDSVEESAKFAAANVQQLLNYCLQFQCHQIDLNTNLSLLGIPHNVKAAVERLFLAKSEPDLSVQNHAKSDTSSSVHYICAAKDTWLGRNTFSMHYTSKNVFENEHKLSKKIDTLRGGSEKELFYFLCECCLSLEHGACLQITFRPLNSNRFIPKLAVFLKDYVPKLMKKYMSGSKLIHVCA